MIKFNLLIRSLALLSLLLLACSQDISSDLGKVSSPPNGSQNPSALLAFPGAQGYGAYAVGGRGGQVLEVTNLNDSGPGSLRFALETPGPRTIVFRVGGIIENLTPLKIDYPYVTIAGQTAPEVITLAGEEVRVHASEVIIRYLRIRTGDVIPPRDGWDNRDALNIGSPNLVGGVEHVILDHCSLSWAVDEVFTIWYQAHDITLQNSLVTEGLMNSFHPKGPHSMGSLVGFGSRNISYIHNLIAHNNERNPQFSGVDHAQFVGNVVYNSGELSTEIEQLGNLTVMTQNQYISGPDSINNPYPFGKEVTIKDGTDGATDLALLIERNIGPNTLTDNEDDWPMTILTSGADVPLTLRIFDAPDFPIIDNWTANEALQFVLDHAGATIPYRDPIDTRVIGDVRNGTGAIIDSPSDVGGWYNPPPGTPPVDSDHDGMPDSWELAHGLDPLNPSDAALDQNGDGYTNLEEYLNQIQ